VRAGVALLVFSLAGCGAGDGEGLDQNGLPLGSPPGAASAGDCLTGSSSFLLPPVPGLQPTLDSIQANVFSVDCAVSGCHSGAGAPFGLQLNTGLAYGNLVNVASPRDASLIRVVPGNPKGSFIIQKITGKQTLGDQMPLGGPYLPQSTIDVICQWIANGAPQ
jgi:hypothetical protein